MKYVLLGKLAADWAVKQEKRITTARSKLKELGMKVESVYYTQGEHDFVDIVEAPNPETMLAFSVWYAQQGYGRIRSMPAFDERQMVAALKRTGGRRKKD